MFRKIYSFTNENINSFSSIYNFSNAKVLSVLGSGDQYFTSLLNEASEVELYDINNLAWYYFILKYYSILILSYEEFYDYFVVNKLDDVKYFNKVKEYLPYYVSCKFEDLYNSFGNISWIFQYSDVSLNYDDDRFIPYLDIINYYQLQKMLKDRNLPNFYLNNFGNLYNFVDNKNYDILLTSNIYNHMYLDNSIDNICSYKQLLNKYNCNHIQALYCWWLNDDFKEELLNNNFEINAVNTSKKLKLTNDYVISLRK